MPSKMGRIPKKHEEPVIEKPKVPTDGKITVNILMVDIEKGRPGDSFYCPVSRACIRDIPGAYNVATTRGGIRVFFGTKHGGYRFFPFNEVISGYVAEFDVSQVMRPFHFEVQL